MFAEPHVGAERVASGHDERRRDHEQREEQPACASDAAREASEGHVLSERRHAITDDVDDHEPDQSGFEREQAEEQVSTPELAQRHEPGRKLATLEDRQLRVGLLEQGDEHDRRKGERARGEHQRARGAERLGEPRIGHDEPGHRLLREGVEIEEQDERERPTTILNTRDAGAPRSRSTRPSAGITASAATAPNGSTPRRREQRVSRAGDRWPHEHEGGEGHATLELETRSLRTAQQEPRRGERDQPRSREERVAELQEQNVERRQLARRLDREAEPPRVALHVLEVREQEAQPERARCGAEK